MAEESAAWQPWTDLVPLRTRFVAVDTGTAKSHATLPGQRMVDLYLVARWTPPRLVRTVFDCTGHRRADLLDGAVLGPDGAVAGAEWVAIAPDDPVLAVACKDGGG